MGGEFLEGEFFWGPLLLEKKKQNQRIKPKNSGSKFGRPKFVSQNSALNSDSGDAKSPVQKFVPEKTLIGVLFFPLTDFAESTTISMLKVSTISDEGDLYNVHLLGCFASEKSSCP